MSDPPSRLQSHERPGGLLTTSLRTIVSVIAGAVKRAFAMATHRALGVSGADDRSSRIGVIFGGGRGSVHLSDGSCPGDAGRCC